MLEQSAQAEYLSAVNASEISSSLAMARKRNLDQMRLIMHAQDTLTKEIGSYLHASTLQELIVTKLQLETLAKQALQYNSEISTAIDAVSMLLAEIATQVRDVSHSLSSHLVDGSNIHEAVIRYTAQLHRRVPQIAFSANTSGIICDIGDTFAKSLFRCIQICITNSLQHSGCSSIAVELEYNSSDLIVAISDNGSGFKQQSSTEGMGV
jgi:signal transduction histidine kinase